MKTPRAEAALEYLEHGLQVFPLQERSKEPATKHSFKDCTDNPEQVELWWGFGRHEAQKPDYNVAIACGQVSDGLLVIDIDNHDVDGFATLKEFETSHGKLPETVCAITGTGGKHLLYKSTRTLGPHVNREIGIDLRAEGSYIVAPPSIHPITGDTYEWSISLDDMEITQANDTVYELVDLICKTGSAPETKDRPVFELPEVVGKGERDDTMFRYACSLRAKGLDETTIQFACDSANEQRFNPPLKATTVRQKVQQACKYPAGQNGANIQDALKAAANTRELETALRAPSRGRGGKVEFFSMGDIIIEDDHACKIDGVLSIWNGSKWCSDDSEINVRSRMRAKDCSTNILNEVYKYLYDMAPKRYSTSDFTSGYYIQFKNNKTIDVLTMQEVEPNPGMLIKGTLNVNWNPSVSENDADVFLNNLSQGREDIKHVMLEVLGCCMLSKKPVKKAVMCVGRSSERDGNAANGKSSYIELIKNIMGEDNASFLTLQQLSKQFLTQNLFGKSVNLGDDIPSSFVDENAASDFKRIVTGETITADVKNKAQVKFQPNTTMVFSMNEIPRWSSMGGIERRLLFLPFFAHFTPDAPGYIKDIKELLGREEVKERAAYLAVQVLPDLIKSGQYSHVPEIDDELAAVMRENNAVERWIYDEGIYILDITGKTATDVFNEMYGKWCREANENMLKRGTFLKFLKAHVWTDENLINWRVDNPRGGKGTQFFIPVRVNG